MHICVLQIEPYIMKPPHGESPSFVYQTKLPLVSLMSYYQVGVETLGNALWDTSNVTQW